MQGAGSVAGVSYASALVTLPLLMLLGLGVWSIVPIAWSIGVLGLAAVGRWQGFWITLLLSSAASIGLGAWFFGAVMQDTESSGPDIFGAAFLFGGAIAWIINTLILAAIVWAFRRKF